MEVDFCTIADFADTGSGGKLNIMGVFDRIGVKDFPAKHGSMVYVLRLRITYEDHESEHELQIYCEAPNGEKLFRIQGEIQIGTVKPGEWNSQNHIVKVQNLVFEEPGEYTFRVYIDGELKATTPIKVVQRG